MFKPNVILLTIDGLRADRLGYAGYNRNSTPNIDVLAKESVNFSCAFSTAPVTLHSFPSILTSTYPLDYQGPKKIARPRVLISEVLKENGYLTAAFHSNHFLSGLFGYDKGWDFFEAGVDPHFFTPKRAKQGKISTFLKNLFREIYLSIFPHVYFLVRYLVYKLKGSHFKLPYAKASAISQVAKEFISASRNQEKPFFVWLHFMDVHQPDLPKDYYLKERPLKYYEYVSTDFWGVWKIYSRKKAFQRFVAKNLAKRISGFYDSGIEYLDRQLGDLFNFLKEQGVYDNSIIILSADHGNEFMDHQGLGHCDKLYNELLHVPFLIKATGQNSKNVSRRVSLLDLAPTVCDLLNIKKPPAFKGKSLLHDFEGPIFHQTIAEAKGPEDLLRQENKEQRKIACQHRNFKYIWNNKNRTEELFDLLQDPKEQNNLLQGNNKPKILFSMRNLVKEFENANPPLTIKIETSPC